MSYQCGGCGERGCFGECDRCRDYIDLDNVPDGWSIVEGGPELPDPTDAEMESMFLASELY